MLVMDGNREVNRSLYNSSFDQIFNVACGAEKGTLHLTFKQCFEHARDIWDMHKI